MATVLAQPVGVVRSSMVFLIHLLQTLGTSTHAAPASGCICSGDVLTYECTTVGTASTVWLGSAFKCPSTKNLLILQHNLFLNGGSSCNNGSIVARGVSVEGNNYTSQLNVTVTPDTAGTTIECFYDNEESLFVTLSLTIPTTGPPPAPREVKMSNVNYSSREVTFNWNPVAPDCPSISYNILSSNCGSCPTTTNHTNVTCTDVYVSTGDMCTFAVQTVADSCGRITGKASKSISVHFTSLINLDTCIDRSFIISIVSLATALMVSLVISAIVIVTCSIIVTKKKAEIKALKLQLTITAEKRPHVESIYEDILGAISTQDNSAYEGMKNNI